MEIVRCGECKHWVENFEVWGAKPDYHPCGYQSYCQENDEYPLMFGLGSGDVVTHRTFGCVQGVKRDG